MNAGEREVASRRLLWKCLSTIALIGVAGSVRAIDNPDAPDRVAAFEARAAPFEGALGAADGGSSAARAGRAYADFLESELNLAYLGLLSRLAPEPRRRLVSSQRQWVQWRATEQRFIDRHWSIQSHGSSATLSVAQHRNALTRQRVLQLLRYMAEYP